MDINRFEMKAKVWLYPGMAPASAKATARQGAWHFVTVPKKTSAEIKKMFGGMSRGWGSLPVCVAIGITSWKTSIFWDNKVGAYLLPLKAGVRKEERIIDGKLISFRIEILD